MIFYTFLCVAKNFMLCFLKCFTNPFLFFFIQITKYSLCTFRQNYLFLLQTRYFNSKEFFWKFRWLNFLHERDFLMEQRISGIKFTLPWLSFFCSGVWCYLSLKHWDLFNFLNFSSTSDNHYLLTQIIHTSKAMFTFQHSYTLQIISRSLLHFKNHF